MPAITAQQRSDLVLLVNGVFGAAPTSRVLSNLVKLVEEGNSVDDVATMLTNNTNFESIYAPALLTSEFATQFAANLLGAAATTETTARVEALVTTYLNAGDTRTEAVWKVTKLLSETEDADFATAKAQLNNKADVSLTFALDTSYTELMTLEQLQSVIANVTSDEATVTAAKTAIANGEAVSGVNTGETFTLTTAVDTLSGTSKNDVFNGVVDTGTASNNTLTALDQISGGEGTDTLNVNIVAGALPNFQLSSIEALNLRSAVAVSEDLSALTSVTEVASTYAGGTLALTGSATQNITVSGSTNTVTLDGGKNISVTDATDDFGITIGATTVNAGTISVTDTKQGNGAIAVDGGTDVTINATSDDTGTISVGQGGAAADQASGVVTVNQTLNNDGTAALTGGAITTTGGSTVNVNVVANSSAKAADSDNNITTGAISVTAGNTTSTVNVNQTQNVTTQSVDASGGVTETASIKFGVLKSGDTLTVAGLTFTASKDLTAEQVAAAFADLTDADRQDDGGSTANGVYTGVTSGWTSASASGDTVVFTSTTAATNVADLTPVLVNTSTNSVAPVVTTTAGAANTVTADKSQNDVVFGTVTVAEAGTNSLTNVTINGFGGASAITGTSALLSTLNVANAESGASLTVADTTDELALTLEKVGNATTDSALTFTASPVTLNVTSTGNNYVDLSANAATTLNVSGTGTLKADSTALAALKTVTVTETAGLTLDATPAATIESVNTSATTGTTTVTIDGAKATYTGGAGVDNVTLSTSTALTKAINLGAGDDTVTFGVAVTGSSAALSGGEGTDTLSMTVANAAALDASAQTFYTGFERLTLNDAFGTNDANVDAETIDLSNLGFTSYVTTSGTNQLGGAIDTLTLDKLANNATVVLTATGAIAAQIADAATNASDVLNVVTNVAGTDVTFGTLTANNVETVNITANDTLEDDNSDGTVTTAEAAAETATLTLSADKVATVNLTGSANQTLTVDGTTTTLTTVDASAMTGALTYTAADGKTTVTGGSGNDVLTASGSQDVLIGGAGNDTLTGADLTTLTGGAGNDTFLFAVPTNVNSYSTISDLSSGDVIDLDSGNAGTVVFTASAVTLASTAVFQDYANAAVNALGTDGNDAAWFQYDGNTYIVQSGDTTANNDFQNGVDSIVQITGLVDLSTASYNQSVGTLEIA